MCDASGTVLRDLCDIQEHHDCSRASPSIGNSVEEVWKETQQLMEQSEHLVRVMTHVCSQQLSGVFRTVAKYSQDCWRRCSTGGMSHTTTEHPHPHPPHHHPHHQRHQHPPCPEARGGGGGPTASEEESELGEACRRRGEWRWRRWWCQGVMDSGGSAGPPLAAPHHLDPTTHTPSCPSTAPPTSSSPGRLPQASSSSTRARRSSSSLCGLPSHSSLLTILLLLVATLARFTEGCSSRSTPKPRPPNPTMRPNITYQTYACPPAYAAWYCLNGATCFTIKIGESILYNCECAEGYMGQRCEFKDLDGSYLPQRERVMLETASIAGGATVACVLVFVVLFAVYVFMQKDKDKRYRDPDDTRHSDRQPFSGYQNPRPEMFRTISNPYARTLEELSHVEVQPAGGGTSGVGRMSHPPSPGSPDPPAPPTTLDPS